MLEIIIEIEKMLNLSLIVSTTLSLRELRRYLYGSGSGVGPGLGSSPFPTVQNTDRSLSQLKWVKSHVLYHLFHSQIYLKVVYNIMK